MNENENEAIREVELAINSALIVFTTEEHHRAIRTALLNARGDIREALGEART